MRIRFYGSTFYDTKVKIYDLWLNVGDQKLEPEYINRPAETYIYQHTDYTIVGSLIIDSYKSFVQKILNPLDYIKELLKSAFDLIWDYIKDLFRLI